MCISLPICAPEEVKWSCGTFVMASLIWITYCEDKIKSFKHQLGCKDFDFDNINLIRTMFVEQPLSLQGLLKHF